jgi:heme/copper-type cytochrome/quinol oxidase subunit 2
MATTVAETVLWTLAVIGMTTLFMMVLMLFVILRMEIVDYRMRRAQQRAEHDFRCEEARR